MFDSLGRPANTHPFFTGANEDKIRSGLKPQGPFVTTPRQKEGEQKPFLVTKEIA